MIDKDGPDNDKCVSDNNKYEPKNRRKYTGTKKNMGFF